MYIDMLLYICICIGLNNNAPDDMNCTSQLPVSALYNCINDVLY